MRMTGTVKAGVCAAALILGAGLRLSASTLGWNFDIESFFLVGHLMESGRNVYVETGRMPYGPVSPAIFALALQLERALGFDGIAPFHFIVAGILTVADMGIALTLLRAYGYAPAIVFALSPVSILITGYHSQIDNAADGILCLSRIAGRVEPDDCESVSGDPTRGVCRPLAKPFWVVVRRCGDTGVAWLSRQRRRAARHAGDRGTPGTDRNGTRANADRRHSGPNSVCCSSSYRSPLGGSRAAPKQRTRSGGADSDRSLHPLR